MKSGIAILLALGLGACDKAPTCDVSKLVPAETVEDVIRLCGRPSKINGSNFQEQWVYDHKSYIYIRNGHFSDAQWVQHP